VLSTESPLCLQEFEVWLREVKHITEFNGPKWEQKEMFKEYMEDFNTCTFPHEKYATYISQKFVSHKEPHPLLRRTGTTTWSNGKTHSGRRSDDAFKRSWVKQSGLLSMTRLSAGACSSLLCFTNCGL